MPQSIDSLNQMSLAQIRRLFTQLDPPEHASLRSVFRGVWSERLIVNFHKFSVVVWLIWLVPYFNGFFVSMR